MKFDKAANRLQQAWRKFFGPTAGAGNWTVFGDSHVGLVRTNNEDHYLICRLDSGGLIVAVADGVGGQNAGEVASQLACDTIRDYVKKGAFDALAESADAATGVLTVITHEAHRAIAGRAREEEAYCGMACTLTVALVLGERVVYIQVGDSRLYHFHAGTLRQVSRDQTISNALVDSGRISRQEAATHPDRNVLEQALGLESSDHPLELQKGVFEIFAGDTLLLCSDGLTDMVDDELITRELADRQSVSAGVEALIKHALAAGGKDNVTVVVARDGPGAG